ncbi:Uncharacterised protein [Klebsiella quasipneumoniae]|uniref:hypothetical protein n=1 Tax=Klebsiella quasipneumoniae TaxID=1463165 RepID=UPI0012551CC0|nr:hypothetical protein [Klebsiella quasipneumoniae]VAS69430.1 Uncharacterised protein [Klebsiella quasipneumoniae]
MYLFDFEYIEKLAKTEPNKVVYLHWEGDPAEAKKTTPWRIVDDMKDGEYTAEDFDEYAYCCSEEDWLKAREEQED